MINYERKEPAATPDPSAAEVIETEPARERVFVGTGLFWRLIVGVIMAVVIVLAVYNTGTIAVSFLSWEFSTPLIVLIFGAFLGGVVVAKSLGLVHWKRRRSTLQERHELPAAALKQEST